MPLATLVRRRLRALGTTHIPRGPRGETKVNPAGLTVRQIDVQRLLSKGYTNAQIASQLVVSVRTVDSHVAAVLGKLGAASAARPLPTRPSSVSSTPRTGSRPADLSSGYRCRPRPGGIPLGVRPNTPWPDRTWSGRSTEER